MFKALIKAETLKSTIYIVGTVVDEVKLSINPEGITIRALDASRIAMIDVSMSSEAFITYEADECEIGLDLDKVKAVLKLADSSDDILMEHDVEKGRLTLKFGNITRSMSLVDASVMKGPKTPDIQLSGHITMPADVLKTGIKASESIDDRIYLTLDSQGFEISCRGDNDFASVRMPAESFEKIEMDHDIRCGYPINIFSNFVKSLPDKVVIHADIDNDLPMMLNFTLSGDAIRVKYLLAPCISE